LRFVTFLVSSQTILTNVSLGSKARLSQWLTSGKFGRRVRRLGVAASGFRIAIGSGSESESESILRTTPLDPRAPHRDVEHGFLDSDADPDPD